MTLFAFGSAKGSPGVTTGVLALAASWPRKLLVAELDPDGGDVAAWFGLSSDPGVVSCAAHGRRTLDAGTLLSHAQTLSGPAGVGLLAGPDGAEQARAALATLCPAGLAECLARLAKAEVEIDVFADCGRIAPESPVLPLLSAARSVVLVARPRLEQVSHLQARVAALRQLAAVEVLLIGTGPYDPAEVAAAVGAPVAGVLAEDPRGAAAMAGRAREPRLLARSALLRSAGEIALRWSGEQAQEQLDVASQVRWA